ncbi:hypothetical protein D3C78_1222540 [compost metagenome]
MVAPYSAPSSTLAISTGVQETRTRSTSASARVPNSTSSGRGSPKYHHSKVGNSAQSTIPRASFRPRRSRTSAPAAALTQNSSGKAAATTTARVACRRPRMTKSASARMYYIR